MGSDNSVSIKDLQRVELEILKEFVRVCDKYSLKYIMYWGSLLGAMRHNGFIPWDDDLDIMMPRADYEELKRVANKEFPGYLFIQDYDSDAEFPGIIAKIRNSNTTLIERGYKNLKHMNHGMWIDIVLCDPFDDNRVNHLKRFLIRCFRKLMMMRINSDVARVIIPKKLCAKAITLLFKSCGSKESDLIVTSNNSIRVLDKDYIDRTMEVSFEKINVRVPQKYDELLTSFYGDWRKLPPEEEQVPRHIAGHVSTEMPYTEFI